MQVPRYNKILTIVYRELISSRELALNKTASTNSNHIHCGLIGKNTGSSLLFIEHFRSINHSISITHVHLIKH